MVERTLVFIKPDGFKRKLVGRIITRFEEKDFKVAAMKMLYVTKELSDKHYEEHLKKEFYPELREFITSGPVIAMVLEGRKAVEVVRKIVGSTDGAVADAGTIRGDFSLSNRENIAHASDSIESAEREIKNFFEDIA